MSIDDTLENDYGRRDYISAETTVLLHRAAEALLRLYLAHSNSAPCLWLEVARLRHPGVFPDKLRNFLEHIDTPDTQTDPMSGFTGRATPPEDQPELGSKTWRRRRLQEGDPCRRRRCCSAVGGSGHRWRESPPTTASTAASPACTM
jgi:hypothetical protein